LISETAFDLTTEAILMATKFKIIIRLLPFNIVILVS